MTIQEGGQSYVQYIWMIMVVVYSMHVRLHACMDEFETERNTCQSWIFLRHFNHIGLS